MRSTTIYILWSKERFWQWLKMWIRARNLDWRPTGNFANYRRLVDPPYLTIIEQGPPYVFEVWMEFLYRGTGGQRSREPILALSFALTEYGGYDRVGSKVVIRCDERLERVMHFE